MNKKLLVLITFLFSFVFGYGQTETITASGAGAFVVPCGVTSITVEAWGGGGSGGGQKEDKVKGGGGGAGGAYASSVITGLTPGQIIQYFVGKGAKGDTKAGLPGEGSWVVDLKTVFAQGGAGGAAPNNGNVSGGTGSTISSFGNFLTPGINGGNGSSIIGGSGGAGANPGGGSGGSSVSKDNNGNPGSQPGGGGGGAFVENDKSRKGGDGGDGQVKITYTSALLTYCVPSFNTVIEPITNVTFAGINRTTTNTLNGTPAVESFCDVAIVAQGTTYPISIKGNTDGPYTTFITVYVDWNQNGVFENIPNERYDIGTIQNSNGDINSTPSLGNINVPIGALVGNTRMRVIKSFNNNSNSYVLPCSSNGWGQAEDYTVTVLPLCVPPGNTITTANAVCANTPFTLSLQNTSASTVAYQWQTSVDNISWNNVTSVPFFNTDFASQPANTNVYESASVTGGELVLTTNVNDRLGGYVVQSTPGSNINSFTASFDYRMFDGNGADGMSLSYGSNIGNDQGGGEEGDGTGLIIKFDSYDNTTNTTASQIRIFYGGVQIFANTLNSFALRNLVYRNVLLSTDGNGLLSLKIGTTTIVSGLSLPAGYLSSNKSNWKFKFSARTGGLNDKHSIDNLNITYLNSTFTTTQTVPTYYRSIVTCGGTTNTSTPVLVTMDPMPPTLGAVTPLTCVAPTGSVVLSGLPSSGTLKQTGFVTKSYPITAATMTISDLAAGDYYFAVNNGTCESVISPIVKIAGLKTTKWDGSVWDNGKPISTNSTNNIIFAANYTSDGNLEGCDCTVNAGVKVTVQSGHALKITNAVKVNTAAGTSLTFENNASLIQENDNAINSGDIIYKRLSNKTVRNTDYTYWSTPVSPLNLAGANGISYNPSSLAGSIFYSYEVTAGSEDWESKSAASPMIIGKGYSIRGPGPISANPLTKLEATFTGKPNNGRYPIAGIHPDKSYLIGNPYPSALDADKFLTDNSGVLDGTLYFWTHNTTINTGVSNPGSGVYAYSGDDYASYNLTGGTGTDGVTYPKGGEVAPSGGGVKPSGKIGAGQGFFATSNKVLVGAKEIVFNNSMRVGVGGLIGDNTQFFKTKNSKSKTTSTIEKNRIWLNLFNTQGAFKQLLVGYVTGATNEFDNGYDGETFDANEFIDFYSINQDQNFVIQGRAIPFEKNDEVPLGYRSVIGGDLSIGIDEVDGMMQSQEIYLEDKMVGLVHDLKVSPYTFTTAIGTFDDRFVLRYTDKTLGVADLDQLEDQVIISKDKNELKIKSANETIKRVTIFDLLGKKVFDKEALDETEFRSSNVSLFKQTGIVKVTLATGQIISKKVAF